MLRDIFTWWFGGAFGPRSQIRRTAKLVGNDDFGNTYYESVERKYDYDGRNRRFVIYKGYADASKVPAEWHGWLHHTFAEPPTREPLKRRAWEKDHLPNLTGTIWAWRPQGSLSRGGDRQPATADYQPWTPD